MGFFKKFKRKFIPRELSKPVDEFLDFGSDVVEKGITKPFASVSDKLLPNELRFLAPYAAGIGTLMLPPGMNMFARAALASMMNAGGQIAADESATGELGDLNKLSMAIAGGLGALGAKDVTTGGESATGIREGIVDPKAVTMDQIRSAPIGTSQLPADFVQPDVGFLQGAENLGREGIAQASDYIQGTRSALADIGKDPASLFKYDKTANILKGESKLPGVTKAAGALLPTATLGTADVAYEAAIDAQKLFDDTEAAEMAEAGASLDEIQNARRAAIREAMESAQFTEQDILDTLAEIGLKDGGIASLKNGGILGFNDGGRVGFADGDHVKKNLGYREREGDSMPMPMGLGIPPSGNYADNFLNQSPKTLTVDNTDNSNPYSNDKRRKNVIQAMMAAKHSQATIDEALGELGLKNGGIIGLKDGGMLDLGGNEMDYRGGGFIPMGSKERADDVPARLSKNEFVMTADAVRAAGGGSVNKGAQRMYDIMNRLEAQV
jgi:hypothetical protein